MEASPASDRWGVVLASRAIAELRKLQRDQNALDIVWKKIRELSAGQFTEDNHTAVRGSTTEIPIYRARLSNDLRIIYHIDIAQHPSGEFDYQVIKILRIDSRAHIDYGFWSRVAASLNCHGSEYHERRPMISGSSDTLRPQKHFTIASTLPHLDITYDQRVLTWLLASAIVANLELSLPILLDPPERDIVNHRGATIVVGRSGTGKTTALMYRMKAINQFETEECRQMFVTRSPVLARHVESGYRGLVTSAAIAHKTEQELADLAQQSNKGIDQSLMEYDNEIDLRDDLPGCFSELEGSHFPLFISFDKLCSLIEGDLFAQFDKEHKDEPRTPWSARSDKGRKQIGYDEFREQYWPRFNMVHKLGLSPALVYSEIMGVIKGSSVALNIQGITGYLERDQYVQGLTHRIAAQLDVGTRERIYTIFDQYRTLKAARFELDPADRAQRVFKYLSGDLEKCQARKKLVDYLYVDEVQDNLMADVQVLRQLGEHVSNTYWGGDTAQTIVAGSAFQIRDLGAYLYDESAIRSKRSQKSNCSGSPFTKFELTVNFRSHEGIVRCAASVVQAIYNLFPDSVDHMPPETARRNGPLPLVLTQTGSETSFFESFLLKSNSDEAFGAQQAILVRSDAVVERLGPALSEICPILTITESKGLEFDDVLLYDFFVTSENAESWEFVHGFTQRNYRSAQELDPPISLCNDLKLLYVGITRARKRCWIWDHGDVIAAMTKFWLSRGLVRTASALEMTSWGSSKSTAPQWIEKGQEYFANGMYKLAAGCFRRGGDDSKARIAGAYQQMSRAKLKMLRQDNSNSRAELKQAADALSSCARDFSPADKNARHLWFHVATCLELAHDVLQASKAFVKAGFHERATCTLFDHDDIDNGVNFLLTHWEKLGEQLRETLLDRSRTHYFESQEYRVLPRLFDSLDDQLVFARTNNFILQLKYLLGHNQRYNELAKIYLDENSLSEALEWYIRDFDECQQLVSLIEGAQAFINRAEWVFVLEGKRSQRSLRGLQALIEKLHSYLPHLEPKVRKEIVLFRDLLNSDLKIGSPITLTRAKDWGKKTADEKFRKALIFHLALQDVTWVHSRFSVNIINHLGAWTAYNSIISPIVDAAKPSKLPSAQRLLGFKPSGSASVNSLFVVSESSVIYELAGKQSVVTQRNSHDELLVPARWIDKLVKDGFCDRLHEQLRAIYHGLLRSGWIALPVFKPMVHPGPAFTPAPSAPLTHALTSDREMRARLNAAMVAISALAPVRALPIEEFHQNRSALHLWVRRLFDILYPPSGTFEVMDCLSAQDKRSVFKAVHACIKQYLTPRSYPNSTAIPSTFENIIGQSLIGHLGIKHANRAEAELSKLPQPAPPTNVPDAYQMTTRQLACFANLEDPSGLTAAILILKNAIAVHSTAGQIDAAVLVHLAEQITCQAIFYGRAKYEWFNDGFSGLILPYSWARYLAGNNSNAQALRETESLAEFIEALSELSDRLKFTQDGRWMVRDEALGPPWQSEIRQPLNLRICWCLALLAVNVRSTGDQSKVARKALFHAAGGALDTPYQSFHRVNDLETCLRVLCETIKHETLVKLSNGKDNTLAWQNRPEILVLTYVKPAGVPRVVASALRE